MTDARVTITIFGSSKPVRNSAEYRLAYNLGRRLAGAGYTICNGGYGGTMEATARGSKSGGGSTIGVTLEEFRRPANQWIDREIRMPTLMERLMELVSLGDGYVVLRGGTGTLLELSVVWELINKGMMKKKPVVALGPFWKPIVRTVRNQLKREGHPDGGGLVFEAGSVGECVSFLGEHLRAPSEVSA